MPRSSIHCPACGHHYTKTIDTRGTDSLRGRYARRRRTPPGNSRERPSAMVQRARYRRRKCVKCDHRFTTVESLLQDHRNLQLSPLVQQLSTLLVRLRTLAPDVEQTLRAARALLPPALPAQSQVDGEQHATEH